MHPTQYSAEQVACHLSSLTFNVAAVGTAQSLTSSHWNDEVELHLFPKHLRCWEKHMMVHAWCFPSEQWDFSPPYQRLDRSAVAVCQNTSHNPSPTPTRYMPDQNTITSTEGLYMQPQTHADCMRDCNTEKILFYFIVKRTIF
jgi:hypothetical protein